MVGWIVILLRTRACIISKKICKKPSIAHVLANTEKKFSHVKHKKINIQTHFSLLIELFFSLSFHKFMSGKIKLWHIWREKKVAARKTEKKTEKILRINPTKSSCRAPHRILNKISLPFIEQHTQSSIFINGLFCPFHPRFSIPYSRCCAIVKKEVFFAHHKRLTWGAADFFCPRKLKIFRPDRLI